jgi:ornithine cyclodeaminase/alanine dehydrogenase-like protein (mu-crystallin family)
MSRVVALVEQALAAQTAGLTVMPPKSELASSSHWFLHAMPAIVSPSAAGIKWVSYNPANRMRGLPGSSALLILNDTATGLPYCILDALWATYARTAACAILAMRRLAIPGFRTVALIGAGQLARTLVPHLDAAFPHLRRFQVVTRSAETAQAFCKAMAPRLGAAVVPVRDVSEATAAADVVISTAGESTNPPLGDDHFHPGMLALPMDAESSWTTDALNLADRVYVDDKVAFANGFRKRRPNDTLPAITGELHELLAGTIPGREHEGERIFCSNNGIAILDVVLGVEIHRRAIGRGVGLDVPVGD